jgi:hypothetical protein
MSGADDEDGGDDDVEDDNDAYPPSTRGFKHRINQFFWPRDAERVDAAVTYVHSVMCDTSLLIKFRLVKIVRSTLDRATAPMIIDEKLVANAIRAVVGRRDLEGGSSSGSRSFKGGAAAKAARQIEADAWASDYCEMASECVLRPPPLRNDDLSVSHIFGLAATQYAAAALSNIRYHFRQYVCRCLGLVLRSKVATIEGGAFDGLTTGVKKRWRREFGKAYDDVLLHRLGTSRTSSLALHSVIERHRDRLVPPLPPDVTSVDDDLSDAQRPYVYLGYMVRMVTFLEATGERGRLLSPTPLKTSFVPAHYSIDTSSIAHLLMDAPRIKAFRNYFEKSVAGGFPIPNFRNKATMLSSLSKLSGRATVTALDEERFKDALWTYLANFKNRRTRILNPLIHDLARRPRSMRFDHSISTDGYSVTLVVSDRKVRGRKHQFRSAVRHQGKKAPVATTEFRTLTLDTAPEVVVDPTTIGVVGGDPGKGVLLQLVNSDGLALRYTNSQRRHDTLSGTRGRKVMKARRKRTPGFVSLPPAAHPVRVERPSAMSLENAMRKYGASPRTTDLTRFRKYIALREASRRVFEAAYTRKTLRAMRFLAWALRRTSVERFAARILEKFGIANPATGQRSVTILYGDWGRRPNLKHQAPSPGIGLRRILHATPGIVTITVREAYTSSFCPRCGGHVGNDRGAHGLLRCNACGVRWSRDVLGAKNILAKGMHLLTTQAAHPIFGG